MIRKIIHIDEEKCTGCGLCAAACHEGAIEIVNGKAKLAREHFCDGLGDCLPGCPVGAITFEMREAPEYDEEAVRQAKKQQEEAVPELGLRNWPVQIKLAPFRSPKFDRTDLLLAADCTAYAYAAFHSEFARGKTVLIGCSKLDGVDYSGKLTELLRNNDFRSLTLLRMEVPCCGGLERMAEAALNASGKNIPRRVITIGIDGTILER